MAYELENTATRGFSVLVDDMNISNIAEQREEAKEEGRAESVNRQKKPEFVLDR